MIASVQRMLQYICLQHVCQLEQNSRQKFPNSQPCIVCMLLQVVVCFHCCTGEQDEACSVH